jgi:membrane fusion protein, heavy metal efflux system
MTISDSHVSPATPEAAHLPSVPAPGRQRARLQFGAYVAVTLGVLGYLLWHGAGGGAVVSPAPAQSAPVRLSGAGHISVVPDSPIEKKLQVASIETQRISVPVLTVTGTVIASLRPAKDGATNWQFSSPDVLTAYTDWQKATAEIAFSRTQLESIRQLSESRVAAQQASVRRLRRLVEAGTDTEQALASAEAESLQAQIQGRKDVHEADAALLAAQRSETALRRQLQQAGVDADLLNGSAGDTDIVAADVPEAMLSRVKLHQGCEARFLGLGERAFAGTVRAISPVLSKEQRSLRVLFTIGDPHDLLRPGMFADIGLGTDARDALLAPAAGIVHVGRSDFMLVRAGAAEWRVTPVQVGELHETAVEILDGLQPGDQVISQGAILLKPAIVEVTQKGHAPSAGER